MNYLKIYNSLIHKRTIFVLDKKCGIYVEKHHIIPKSCNGKDVCKNLIFLTAREHYIAHLLLCKIYKNTKYYANMLLAIQRFNKNNTRFNSRLYEAVKNKLKQCKIYSKNGKKGGKLAWKDHELMANKIRDSIRNDKTYCCELCNYISTTVDGLHKHYQEYHRNTCKYCGKTFDNYNIKNAHMLHCIKHPKYQENLETIKKACDYKRSEDYKKKNVI